MGSVCAEHHHRHQNHHQGYKFHPLLSSPTKKSLQDLNIPPRKLLSRRDSDYSEAATALMHKFLPSNDSNDDGFDPDDDDDPYSSDEFRMYEFKVRKCTRSRSHDWTDCPFSHPGEKARRRDPRRFHYSGTVCPEYRRSGGCSRGDECEFAHGVFECWLHPARYRTEACKDGKSCKRKVCFFAHSPRELRVLPVEDDGEERDPCCHRGKHTQQHQQQQHQQHQQQCCRYCCALSPTSTLLGLQNFSPPMSPSLSPPMSPMKAVGVGARGLSRYSDRAAACVSKGLTYEDMVIADLLGSLEGMNLTADPNNNKGVSGSHQHGRGLWVDVTGYDNSVTDEYHRQHQQQQMQFSNNNQSVFSTPSRNNYFSPINNNNNSDSCVSTGVNNNPNNSNTNNDGMVDESPDLGWVNDLLM